MSDVQSRIEAHAQRLFKRLHRNGNGTLAFNCPAHDDKRASGSLSVGQNGRPLLKCHAGCTNEKIARALGFKAERDLYSALDSRLNGKSRTLRKVAQRRAESDRQKKTATIPESELLNHPVGDFVFRSAKGKRLYKEVRYEFDGQKTIRMFTYADGRWVPQLRKDVPRVPYRADELPGRRFAWWVEGPKKVQALQTIGLFASTSIGGANGWREEHRYAQQLKEAGIERIYILPDHDNAGHAYAEQVARACDAVGIRAKILNLGLTREGDDIVDWLVAGHSKAELLRLRRETPWFAPGDGLLKRLSDVAAEKVEWFWYPFIPLGKLTLIEGDPGIGKSYLSLALAHSAARGRGLPRMLERKPTNVVLCSAEDGLGDTIRPRLDAMRADVSRIYALDEPLVFDDDGLRALDAAIKRVSAGLVVVDPLVAYLGAGVDLHRANETRAVMARLADIAATHGCAIVLIRHLTKSGKDKSIYRGLGSIDLTAACRSVLLVGRDPENPNQAALVHIKSNLAKAGDSQGYTVEDGKFRWTGTSSLTASDLLAPETGSSSSAVDEAESFVRAALKDGPKEASEVQKLAVAAGISKKTLRRAKERLGVLSRPMRNEKGRATSWTWRLPKTGRGERASGATGA